jgi:hypothetical protein
MGWVENRFLDEEKYEETLSSLWNEFRDALGTAVKEFSRRVSGSNSAPLSRKDCTARGNQYCVRLQKSHPDESLEVFIDENDKSLKTALQSEPSVIKTVCNYRLKADRSGLEFAAPNAENGFTSLGIEAACEMAIGSFLFSPFPRVFFNSFGTMITRH